MNIHEYQAKQLLAQHGVVVPAGEICTTPEEVRTVAVKRFSEGYKRIIIKSQIHAGGRGKGTFVIDTPHLVMQIVGDVAQGVPASMIAKKFHAALDSAVMGVCLYVKYDTGLTRVALSGGVFQNAILSELCENALAAAGFSVYVHARLPPNDGGISTGQALVAREVVRCASRYRCAW
jgi:hydrogenase maturation factor HypF (carbamoyltransferase family)